MATVDITRIASNIGALNSLNSLMTVNNKLAMHQTRLSTGKRINRAADAPAGLTIATKMLARSEGLKVTLDNIGDAKNMLSVAEGGLSKMTDIITQMRSKAEQAASDTLGSTERSTIQTQLSSYAQQLNDIIEQTKWNGVKLLDNATGTKTFQTGVDELETTLWTLPGALDPSTLNLSKKVDTAEATVSSASASFANVTSQQVEASGTLNNMSEVGTGDYTFEITGLATSATQGSAALDSSSKLITGVKAIDGSATAAATDKMTSGRYQLTIDEVLSETDVSYTIKNLDDDSWNGNGAMKVDNEDISGGDVLDDGGAGAATLGLKLDFTDATNTAAALIAGQSMTFEYIAANEVKVALTDSTGSTLQINRQAVDFASSGDQYSSSSAYVAANSTYNSGRGASIKMAAVSGTWAATFNKGDTANFTYEQANNYSVNVSNSAKAGKYMTTVNSALDRVTSALSDLGSLMARLTFKEDSVATAQINVEASYNRIMNANMAEEQMNASKYSILQQTAIAMLAQANQAPQNLLSLFR